MTFNIWLRNEKLPTSGVSTYLSHSLLSQTFLRRSVTSLQPLGEASTRSLPESSSGEGRARPLGSVRERYAQTSSFKRSMFSWTCGIPSRVATSALRRYRCWSDSSISLKAEKNFFNSSSVISSRSGNPFIVIQLYGDIGNERNVGDLSIKRIGTAGENST